jgi:hypothetical protein
MLRTRLRDVCALIRLIYSRALNINITIIIIILYARV